MNKARREAISKIADQIDTCRGELEALRDEEQEYFDAMPESLQGGEKGENAQAAAEALDNAVNQLDEALGSLNEAEGY